MCDFSKKFPSLVLIFVLFLFTISACGEVQTATSTENNPVSTPSQSRFGDPAYPFTFSIPIRFQALPNTQGEVSIFFEVADLNGIAVRQIGAGEFSIGEIEGQLTNNLPASGVEHATIRRESYGSQEMLVLQGDITFASDPPTSGHTLSYFFSVGGASWQIEFYGTENHWNEVLDAAQIVMASISFRSDD